MPLVFTLLVIGIATLVKTTTVARRWWPRCPGPRRDPDIGENNNGPIAPTIEKCRRGNGAGVRRTGSRDLCPRTTNRVSTRLLPAMRPEDAAVAVTRGALELLNREELQGVIAHEFSHVLNGDMRLNIRLMGVLFGIIVLTIIGRRILFSMRHVRSRDGAKLVAGRDGRRSSACSLSAGWVCFLRASSRQVSRDSASTWRTPPPYNSRGRRRVSPMR